jgi:glycerophosphoryl diester phosphodiesterase
MEQIVAEVLARNGLADGAPTTRAILQSFDADSLRTMARLAPKVPRVLLIEPGDADRWAGSADAVKALAAFVTGIGPNKAILERQPAVVDWAHRAGLTVTPWTFRSRSTGRFANVTEEMSHFLYDLGVDALFTDNPDLFPRTPVRR